MRRLPLITLAATLAIALGLLALYRYHAGFLDSIETRAYDFRARALSGIGINDSPVGVVAIDDKSLGALGRFQSWSRMNYVDLIDELASAEARALLMDAFFPEEESGRVDAAFASAMKGYGNVTLASALNLGGDPTLPEITISLPELTEAASLTAQINFLPDEDGVNRWAPLVVVSPQGEPHISLGLSGAMQGMELSFGDIEPLPDESVLRLGDRRIPVRFEVMDTGYVVIKMLVSYVGMPPAFERFSFSDIAQGRVASEKLRDRVLFMGATSLGIYDMRETPFDPNTPGVEVHATVADNIISGKFMRQGDRESALDMAAIVLLALLVWAISVRLRPAYALPLAGLFLGIYIWLSFAAFARGYWINMVYPSAAIIITSAMVVYLRFVLVDSKARRMHSIFSSYVSKKIVDQLAENPEAAHIGGDTKEITILFSDIAGYTSYSERRTPEEVVETLNQYLGAMAGEIIDHDGTLDKFLGDGIMAYWGAPLAQREHAQHALGCALEMLSRLQELNDKWQGEGKEPFNIRIGLNSGRVVAGNMGAAGKKMEYTVIGDTVNLAARLESTAKLYGVTVLLSMSTRNLAGDGFVFREIDRLRVVGKTEPVTVYELIGRAGEVDEERLAKVQKFESALAIYRQRKFAESVAMFNAIGDNASGIYVERARAYMQSPPSDDWDGVYTRTTK